MGDLIQNQNEGNRCVDMASMRDAGPFQLADFFLHWHLALEIRHFCSANAIGMQQAFENW